MMIENAPWVLQTPRAEDLHESERGCVHDAFNYTSKKNKVLEGKRTEAENVHNYVTCIQGETSEYENDEGILDEVIVWETRSFLFYLHSAMKFGKGFLNGTERNTTHRSTS